MSLMQLQVMDPEEQAAHHEAVLAANKVKARLKLAASNRAAGHAEPKPGDQLIVSSVRGIKLRSRAGITFAEGRRTTVHIANSLDGEIEGHAYDDDGKPIENTVTPHGAEMILADDGLTTGARSATEADAAELRSELAAAQTALEKLRAENARLQREARMSAQPSPTGAPTRLAAARKAGSEEADFGGTKK
jgi:hypothetical protein